MRTARKKLTVNKQQNRPFYQADAYPIDIPSSASPPVPKVNLLPLIQLGAIITASIGAEGFSNNGIFNNLFASADFEVLNSLWQSFAASQGNIAPILSNNAPFNPMFFIWMVDQLNLPFSSMMMLYVLLSSIIKKFPSAAEAYINESTEELRKNLLAERQRQNGDGVSPLSRRYRHENAESWDLLFRSKRRIAEIQFQSTTRKMIKGDNENFYKIAATNDELSTLSSEISIESKDWRTKMLNVHKKVSSSAERMRNFGKAAYYGTMMNYGEMMKNNDDIPIWEGDIASPPVCDFDKDGGVFNIHEHFPSSSSSSGKRMRNFGKAAYYGKRMNNYDKKVIASSPPPDRDLDAERHEIIALLQQCRSRLEHHNDSLLEDNHIIEPVSEIENSMKMDIAEIASTSSYLKTIMRNKRYPPDGSYLLLEC